MIEKLINTAGFQRYFPPFAGVVFVAIFVSLGLWQLDRAAEKKTLLGRFEGAANYVQVSDYATLDEYTPIALDGRFAADRQVLIENIVQDGQVGYYVITPFEPANGGDLLLVNRGWIPRSSGAKELPMIDVAGEFRSIRGLAGRLPRVAIRPGEAFAGADSWPRIAVYPRQDEIAAELGADLLPVVLLLAADESDGYVRRWQPNLSGPMTHYGYAFQWFAMAITVVALLVWHLHKRGSGE